MECFKASILLAFFLTIISCDTYDRDLTIQKAVDNVQFECFNGSSEFYMKGVFREDSVCIFHAENGYKISFGYGNGFVTSSPTFTLEELQTQESSSYVTFHVNRRSELTGFLEGFQIKTQPKRFGTPLDSMVKEFLIPGTFPIRGVKQDGTVSMEGFELLVNQWYYNPELTPDRCNMTLTSALGVQPSSSYVRILEVSIEKNGLFYEGHILLNLKCKMFISNAADITGDFAGDFSGEFRLPIRYKP